MGHKHYTQGHFPANNNNSERFFKFMLMVSVSFHHSCPGFDGMRSIENASRMPNVNFYPLWSLPTNRNFHMFRKQVKTIFIGLSGRCSLSPPVSPSCVCFFVVPTTSKHLLHRLSGCNIYRLMCRVTVVIPMGYALKK